jgi:hypothetical protein
VWASDQTSLVSDRNNNNERMNPSLVVLLSEKKKAKRIKKENVASF